MDVLLHASESRETTRPSARGRLSTIGHGAAFRAFARMARREGIRFMVIGGTYRDVAIRSSSTRDIDIVLIDRDELPKAAMANAGFRPVPGSPHAWHYTSRERSVELQVAALASSERSAGPFSIAFQNATVARIERFMVSVPRPADYVILKLIAARSDVRRRARDLADVQYALETSPGDPNLSVPALRARLRDLYEVRGQRLKELTALLRSVPRPRNQP